jgi:hypothetical protein
MRARLYYATTSTESESLSHEYTERLCEFFQYTPCVLRALVTAPPRLRLTARYESSRSESVPPPVGPVPRKHDYELQRAAHTRAAPSVPLPVHSKAPTPAYTH